MDQGPLVMHQLDAGVELINAFDKYAPLSAAFWAKESDEGEWYLYLASNQINDLNFDLAYGKVLEIGASHPSPWLDPFQVKVVSSSHPLASGVISLMSNLKGKTPTRYHGRRLGGVPVNEVYIYPMPTPVAI